MVGNLVSGKRIAQASGRDLGQTDDNDQVAQQLTQACVRCKTVQKCNNLATSCLSVPLPVRGSAVESSDHSGPRPLHAAQLPGNNTGVRPMTQEACRSEF